MARTLNSTTLSAAVAVDDKRATLVSNSTVKVGQLLFIDKEALLVNGPGVVGTPLVAGDVAEVQRGYAGTAPQAHASGQKVWSGPGSDFSAKEPNGVADASAELVLPRIVLPAGKVFQVIDSKWVVQNDLPLDSRPEPGFAYGASGALTIAKGLHKLTKAGVGVMTLADPTADQEGIVMRIRSTTAQAHTVTSVSGFGGQGGAADVATFGGAIGDGFDIVAVNLLWHVIALRNVTLG